MLSSKYDLIHRYIQNRILDSLGLYKCSKYSDNYRLYSDLVHEQYLLYIIGVCHSKCPEYVSEINVDSRVEILIDLNDSDTVNIIGGVYSNNSEQYQQILANAQLILNSPTFLDQCIDIIADLVESIEKHTGDYLYVRRQKVIDYRQLRSPV